MKEAPFYCVWNPCRGVPTMRHMRYAEAVAEAKRLADRHPGEHFYVLCSVAVVQRHEPVTVDEIIPPEHDWMPF